MTSSEAEYQALRDTIRGRGTARLSAVLFGLVAWGALVLALLIAGLEATTTLVPLLVLAATFEINFFMHTGVERIGRYLQVFHEERADVTGWETTAMNYAAKFPGGLDPLFSALFAAATSLNIFASLLAAHRPGSIAISLGAHIAFGYRILSARKSAASQRAVDLERFRNLAKQR